MLQLVIPASEYWDEQSESFIDIKEQSLQLEHSLVSLSKWESKWCKPFISKEEKTYDEMLDYIKCMTVTKNVDPAVYTRLSKEDITKIKEYIEAPMTATRISEQSKKSGNGEQTTAELIYCWMINLNIPVEFQYWHINRLLTLIRVCDIKSQPPKKMGRKELSSSNAALNAARRKRLGSKG